MCTTLFGSGAAAVGVATMQATPKAAVVATFVSRSANVEKCIAIPQKLKPRNVPFPAFFPMSFHRNVGGHGGLTSLALSVRSHVRQR